MPIRIKKMRLDKMEFLSLVDKGASGDPDNRPAIVLFKRKAKATKMIEALTKIFKGNKKLEKAMGLQQVVGAIDELGLNDEQKAGVLKLLEAFASPAKEPDKAEPAPVPKADEPNPDDPPIPPNPEEDEEMRKRAAEKKELEIELKKRDDRIAKLEDEALTLKLQKRADELGFLPGYSRDETIELLKKAQGDPKFDAMLTKLVDASKDSPLFRAAGAVVHEDENSPEMVVRKRVKAIQDKEPEVNPAVARERVLKADNELYKAILAAQQ
jgi:hypothetical protein